MKLCFVLGLGSRASSRRAHVGQKKNLRLGRLVLSLCSALAVSGSFVAVAQTSPADKAMAEALFDRGVKLMKQGKFSEACNQLEQSEAIEQGVGTMLYLAECYEKLGRTASAWAMFREGASAAHAAGQLDRAKTGSARADRLEPLLSRLTIQVDAQNAPPGLEVLRNEQPLPSGAWGQPIPVDPGEQRVEARASGYATWNVTLNLPANGAMLTVDVPQLTALEAPAPPPPAANVATVPEPVSAPPAAVSVDTGASDHANKWQRPLGLALGGAGVLALGIGTYFGLHAISKNNAATSNDHCTDNRCDLTGFEDTQDALDSAAAANVFVFGGLGLLIGGAVVYFTAPHKSSAQVSLHSHGSGALLSVGGAL